MRIRFRRGIVIAGAMGLILSGGVAQATDSAPAVNITWTAGVTAPFGGARLDAAKVGDRVYVLGFRLLDGTTDGSIWYFDIPAQQWFDTGIDTAFPVTNYTIAVLKNNKGKTGLYTFGGRSATGETSTTVQVYYPSNGKTKILTSDTWPGTTPSACTSLPATGVAVRKNKAYVMGGMSFSTSIPACVDDQSAQVWSFDPTAPNGAKWTAQPSLNVARGYISTAVVGKRIYAIGGDLNTAGTLTAQPTVETWVPGDLTWDDAGYADLPKGCDESRAFGFKKGPLGGTVTLAGCGQWPNALPDVLQYDVSGNSWSSIDPLAQARRNHAGENIGTTAAPQLFVFGGYDATGGAVLATSEIGTP